MRLLNVLLAVCVLACGAPAAMSPAHAQLFGGSRDEPTYRAPPPRRLPGTGDYSQGEREYAPRRQYIPEQRAARPERRGFFDRLFGRPADRSAPAPERERDRDRDRTRGTADAEPSAPAEPRVAKTVFVAVLGDSLAENLAPGLGDALSERPEVGLVREIRSGQGLLKDAKKTWRASADEIIARTPPVAAAVVFVGALDDPPSAGKKAAADASASAPAAADPWLEQYAAKVDDIALAFRQKNIPLFWVGLPPVEDTKTMADNLALNELVRQRVAALGGTFIDVWEGFVNEDDEFTVQGPNIEGRVVRLRNADGVHFTRAGARKLGHYIELELRSVLAPQQPGEAVADVGIDPTAPTVPGESRVLVLGQAPRTPGAVLAPPPAASAPPKTAQFNPGIITGAEGAAPDPSVAPPEPAKPEENALVTGTAVTPKPGRADDFAWPQTAAN